MTNELMIKEVDFNGDRLLAVMNPENGKVYTGVNMMCEAIGVDAERQRNKIKNHGTLSKGYTVWGVPPLSGGNVQDTFVLELDFVPLWLCSINPSKVRKEVQEKLITFQLKAKDVLANVFIKKDYTGIDNAKYEIRIKELEAEHEKLMNQISNDAAKMVSYQESYSQNNAQVRKNINRLMKDYGNAVLGGNYSKAYGKAYKAFKLQTGIDCYKLMECFNSESILDAIERINMIRELEQISFEEFIYEKDGKSYWNKD